VQIIRSGVDLLNGTPSIVFGLFGFAFLVLYLNFGVSLLAGQITLGLMVLPTIIRTTEEAIKSIPNGLREGSLALGATKWQTIRRVVLPPAMPGVLTGTILSIGRAAGETAPILFTAVVFSRRFLPTSVTEPVMALPYHLFILATNVPGAEQNMYGTALVLLILVVGIYTVAIYTRNRFHRSMKW
ncbi:MAG TPA: phosphate ABC transporter permease PstA, partial [Methanomicrobiales archaeon]|nr:phosphate ABC transporter permease PstA [Methanomicrobiales archaeon]